MNSASSGAPGTAPAAVSACDVLVVGGGPAGSTAATLLARKGWSVILVEKQCHPRFHIGESLLPMNLPLLAQLGVLDQVTAIGVRKSGADFPADNALGYTTFRFADALTDAPDHAFQVQRDEFDEILFRNATANGAITWQNTRIGQLELHAEGVRAQAHCSTRGPLSIQARYLLDASGRDTVLGTMLRLKRKYAAHQSAALYAHFRGVSRRPGADQGNISIYRFAHGWVWLIPLRDDITSVGVVCGPEYLKQRRGSTEQFLLQTLHGVPELPSRIHQATLIGPLHVSGNYSYECRKMAGPRWMMIGDACGFIDPIFSSGVWLAMNSAQLAAEVVDASLREPARETALQRGYQRTVRGGLGAFSWFIIRFTSPAMRHLLANPRNVCQVEQAMIAMLAGDVFRKTGVPIRLLVFKLIYLLHAVQHWPSHLKDYWRRRRQARSRVSVTESESSASESSAPEQSAS